MKHFKWSKNLNIFTLNLFWKNIIRFERIITLTSITPALFHAQAQNLRTHTINYYTQLIPIKTLHVYSKETGKKVKCWTHTINCYTQRIPIKPLHVYSKETGKKVKCFMLVFKYESFNSPNPHLIVNLGFY